MPAYKAPLHDIRFLMNEVLDYPTHYKNLSNGELADADNSRYDFGRCSRFL